MISMSIFEIINAVTNEFHIRKDDVDIAGTGRILGIVIKFINDIQLKHREKEEARDSRLAERARQRPCRGNVKGKSFLKTEQETSLHFL